VLAAAFWGFFAASSLLLGAALALWRPWSARSIGLVMAFGSGVLISSVAFDLVEDALQNGGGGPTTAGMAAGAAAYFVGDWAVSRRGGADRKRSHSDDVSTPAGEEGNPAAIVVGAVLDGIPESVAIGISLLEGGHIGGVFVAAVFMSNIPDGTSVDTIAFLSAFAAGAVLTMLASTMVPEAARADPSAAWSQPAAPCWRCCSTT
jgi:zinc transporter, ZIP family